MPIAPGTYKLGPRNGTLSVRTGRTGAAAKAGHDLLLHVTAWQVTLDVGEGSAPTSIVLDADATSLRVREGTGGMQALADDDRSSIERTIDEEVLKRMEIAFRSTSVEVAADGGQLSVRGDLTLAGTTHPIAFDVMVDPDGRLSGSAVVRQTDWGIKPYSTLFGALKVADEVEVAVDASSSRADPIGPAEEPDRPVEAGARRRLPVVDPVVSSFLWALGFFLYLVFGMAAVGVSFAIALILALVAAIFIFLFVRTHGVGRQDSDQSR
jgi:hypothetical protein